MAMTLTKTKVPPQMSLRYVNTPCMRLSHFPNAYYSTHVDDFGYFDRFQVIIPVSSRPSTPAKPQSQSSTPSKLGHKSSLRLVNYHDDTVISDDDNEASDSDDNVTMDELDQDTNEDIVENDENNDPKEDARKDRFSEYGFSLPPEPKGKCPQELQDKISNMYDKMRTNNMDMNKLIQDRKEFRNPSIYEKLIQYCDIDELGTNYPPELYDPMQWRGEFRVVIPHIKQLE